jgi:hypothetical protein
MQGLGTFAQVPIVLRHPIRQTLTEGVQGCDAHSTCITATTTLSSRSLGEEFADPDAAILEAMPSAR